MGDSGVERRSLAGVLGGKVATAGVLLLPVENTDSVAAWLFHLERFNELDGHKGHHLAARLHHGVLADRDGGGGGSQSGCHLLAMIVD